MVGAGCAGERGRERLVGRGGGRRRRRRRRRRTRRRTRRGGEEEQRVVWGRIHERGERE
jgi:hypothetical protein